MALTAGLTSVKGKLTDANGAVTNPDLTAFTYAGGLIFDISKGAARAFKAGVFWGKDVVGSDVANAYVHNRKNWIALQLGYDFTDN